MASTNNMVPVSPVGEVQGDVVSAQADDFRGLSPIQEKALHALAEGKGPTDAAAIAGVSRATMYRWQHHDLNFAAALNLCRRQRRDEFSARMSAMHDKALSAIGALLDKGDFRAVELVISFIEKQKIGPDTAAAIVARQTRRESREHARAASAAASTFLKMGQIPDELLRYVLDDLKTHTRELKRLANQTAGKGQDKPPGNA